MTKLLRHYKMIVFLTALIAVPGPAHAKEQAMTPEELERQQQLINQQVLQTYAEAGAQPVDPGIINMEVPSDSRYTLGVNDVIEVTVLRHPEVSGQYIINQEGKIQYEFAGDVHVAGQTKDEVTETLQDMLTEFIISPEVTVKIIGYNSKVVYVIGEVGQPGKIFMRGDTITVREALLQAGLPLLTAKVEKSKLFTPSANGVPEQKKVNVKSLLYKGDLRENLVMKPGDTLFIPPTAMTKVMRTIQPVAAPITTGAGVGRTVTTGGF